MAGKMDVSAAHREQRSRNAESRFDEQLVRLSVVIAIDVLIVATLATAVRGRPVTGWTVLLIPLATLASFLPAALGAAAMWIRRSRFALAGGTVAAALTTGVISCDLLNLSGVQLAFAALFVFIAQLAIGLLAKRLSRKNIFPKPLRLATFALLFKLAVVGILASAFVPAERNPLRLLGWTAVANTQAGDLGDQ
jgi:hypothetical protein